MRGSPVFKRIHTCEAIPDLSLWKGAQHVEVKEGDKRSMIGSETILEVTVVDTDYAQ